MSLILEALRKSEAERRRGQTPDLSVELPPTAQRPQRAFAGWRWPAAALLLGVALLLAFALRTPAPPVAEVDQRAAGSSANVAPGPASPAPVTGPSAPPGGSLRSTQAPPPEATPQPVTPAKATAATPSTAAATPSTATAPSDRSARTPPLPHEDAASTAAPSAGKTAAAEMSADLLPPAPPPPAMPPGSPARAPAPATAIEPIGLADLSVDERRQLPPLKISMHMYAPSSAQRFAIVDGKRVGEGDRIGNAVVEAITADAVVLAWNGRRLRVPIL